MFPFVFLAIFCKAFTIKTSSETLCKRKNVIESKSVQERASGHFILNGNHTAHTTMILHGVSYILAHER